MKKAIASILSITIPLVGCATSSKDIAANYVSPIQYQPYDCAQLASEAQRIQARVSQLGGRLDEASSHDKAIMGVGLILFWPALFALGGTKEQEAEYGRLKGEYDAVQQASIAKKCPGAVAPVQTATLPSTVPAQTATTPAAAPGEASATPATAPAQAGTTPAVAQAQTSSTQDVAKP